MIKKLSYDYIRGLTEGEGTFTFYTLPRYIKLENGEVKRIKMPAFAIKMHERDEPLLQLVRDTIGLREKLYRHKKTYAGPGKENAGLQVALIVRDTGDFMNKIIPLFYKKLHGNKVKQFREWLEKMGGEEITYDSQFLHGLYKMGHFDKIINKFD